MHFPPKTDDEECDASSTRPLNLANTDNKINECSIAQPLTDVATTTSYHRQRATKGGKISDAIIDLEADALVASLRAPYPGVLFCDIKAAFPSLVFKYILAVLTAMGIPDYLLHAITTLYTDCKGHVLHRGKAYGTITSKHGVRQGGPASSIIYILCFDPFLRYLQHQLNPDPRTIGSTFFASEYALVGLGTAASGASGLDPTTTTVLVCGIHMYRICLCSSSHRAWFL